MSDDRKQMLDTDAQITEMTGRTAHDDFALTDAAIESLTFAFAGWPAYLVVMTLSRMLAQVSRQCKVDKETALRLVGNCPDWLDVDPARVLAEDNKQVH